MNVSMNVEEQEGGTDVKQTEFRITHRIVVTGEVWEFSINRGRISLE